MKTKWNQMVIVVLLLVVITSIVVYMWIGFAELIHFFNVKVNREWGKWWINFPGRVNNPIIIVIFVGVKCICKWHLKRFGYYLYFQVVVEWI